MGTKQITDLTATADLELDDLFLVRKTGEGLDKKITKEDLIETLGNPAINGFTAISEAVNKITLTPSNEVLVSYYYDGMRISFISPIDSDGVVQVKIGALSYKNLKQIGTTDTSILISGNYYEAVYDSADNTFYQTNIVTPTIFTNEYTAVGVVSGDESYTTLTLTSAYGASKTAYYTGMSLLFITPLDTKGSINIIVDGLGQKELVDASDDDIKNDLYEGETILAIYDGTNFVKNMFSRKEPDAPPLDPDINPDVDPIPDGNKKTIHVGPSRAIKSINNAIAQLRRDFDDNGKNHFITIKLDDDFVWNETVTVPSGLNLKWITITSTTDINVTKKPMMVVPRETVSPILSGRFATNVATGTGDALIPVSGTLFVTDSIFTATTTGRFIELLVNTSSKATITNSTFNGYSYQLGAVSGELTILNSTLNGGLIAITGNDSIINIAGSTINNTGNLVASSITCTSCNVTMTNVTSISTNGSGITFARSKVTLTNCRVGYPNSVSNRALGVFQGSNVMVSGGDYRTNDGVSSTGNIISDGYQTVISLTNSPIGNYTKQNGGEVLTI